MALQGKKTAHALVMLSAFVPSLCTLSGDALAVATASDSVKVSAKVSNPLAVTPSFSFSLNFNSFAIRGTGTYLINPTGAGTATSAVPLGGVTRGTAVLKVPQNASFTLSIPTYALGSDILLKNAGGGPSSKEMTVVSLLFQSRSGMFNATGTLSNGNGVLSNMKVTDASSSGKIAVGARIGFGSNQVEGTYTGTFILRITL